MNYELKEEKQKGKQLIRTYINDRTSTEVKTELLYTDKAGQRWWGFQDLFKIPYIRTAYAKHISDLFTIGLSLKDIVGWCSEEKTLLKSDDPEKYEKLYSLILEKEKIATVTADPIKQHLALCTIYVLADDERIDYFDDQVANDKMILWNADMAATSFFLTWHSRHIADYTKTLNRISQTVSKLEAFKETQLPDSN